MKDKVKEKISFYKNIMTLLFTGFFILSGGLINTLFYNTSMLKNIFKLSLFGFGVLVEIAIIISLALFVKRIRKLLKEL